MTGDLHRCETWLAIGGAIGRLETFRMTSRGQLCRVRLVATDGSHAGYAEELAARFRPAAAPPSTLSASDRVGS